MSFLDSRQIRITFLVLALAAAAIPVAAATEMAIYPVPNGPVCRAYDSRPSEPAERHSPSGPFDRGVVYDVKLDDLCGLPANADGVVINVAAIGAVGPGNLSVFPTDPSPPPPLDPPINAVFFPVPGPGGNPADRSITLTVLFGTNGSISFLASPGPGKYHVKIDITQYVTNTIINDDAFTVAEDAAAMAFDVLGNDTDPDDTLLIASVTQPANGTVVPTPAGPGPYTGLTYQPDADYCNDPPGTALDMFTYTLTFGQSGTVKMKVTCLDDAPVAVDDSATVSEDSGANAIPVLANDTDVDMGPKNIASTGAGPSNGTVALTPPGPGPYTGLTYTPNADYCNSVSGPSATPDTFTYTISPPGPTSTATVSVTVLCGNDAPVLDLDADDSGGTAGSDYAIAFTEGDTAKFIEDAVDATITDDSPTLASLTVTLTNLLDSGFEVLDVDLTGFPAFSKSYDTTTDPSKGVLTLSASPAQPIADFVTLLRKVTYLNSDENPNVTARVIEFVANDGASNSNTATTTVTMAAVNDPPIADDDSYSVSEGGTLSDVAPGVLADDTDPEGSGLTAILDSGPSHDTAFVLNSDGSFSYTHDGSETTSDSFTYHANDGSADSNVATVTITINAGDDPPVAVADSATVNEDSSANSIPVLANDTDADGGPKNIVSTGAGPSNGTVALTPPGPGPYTGLTYTPDPNYCNSVSGPSATPDTFTYTLSPAGPTPTATVSVTVLCLDDAPVLDLDADNSGGTAGSDYAITFTEGDAAKFIEDTADAIIADIDSTTLVSLTVTLTNLLDPGFEVLDVDLTGFPAFSKSYDTTTDPSKGVLTLSASPAQLIADFVTLLRKVTYLNSDENPNATARVIGFVANDGASNSNTATTTVTLVAVNDAPIADDESYNVNEGGTLNEVAPGVLANDSDPEGSALTAHLDSGPLHASPFALNSDGSFNYTHDGGETTSDSFTYHARDGALVDSNIATVTITITAVDDPPVAVADSAMVNEDSGANVIPVLANDTDVDAGPKNIVSISNGPSNGTVALTPPGPGPYTGLTYTPNPNYCNSVSGPSATPDTFMYTISPPGPTSTATVSVTVLCVNDPPMIGGDTTPNYTAVGNSQLRVGGTPPVLAAVSFSTDAANVLAAGKAGPVTDVDGPGPIEVVAASGQPTDQGGTFTIEADGDFTYHPPVGFTGTDTFDIQITDNGSPAGLVSAEVTVAVSEMVWYVQNNTATAGTAGTSVDPFDMLSEAQGASGVNHYIYVFKGDGTTNKQNSGIVLKGGQRLRGEAVDLVVSGKTLVTGNLANRPLVGNTAGNGVSATDVIPAEIMGLGLSGSANAIDLTNGVALPPSATLAIQDNVVRGAGVEGIDVNLNAGTTGTLALNVTNNSWDLAGTHTGNAVDISRTAGTLNLNFSGNTNIVSTANNAVVITSNALGSLNITGFSGNSVHGNNALAGISMSQVTFDSNLGTGGFQQVDGDTLAIGDSINVVGGAGLVLTTVQGNLFFDNLGIYAGTSGLTFTGSGGMTFAVTPAFPGGSGTSVIRANGAAVDITSATIDLRLDDMDSTITTAVAGVSLSSVGGTFSTDTDASIGKTSGIGTAFSVGSSSATVDYAGTLNVTSGSGVSLTSNTGSTTFRGGMSLSTGANTAFSATGGGTVNVCDENPCNPGSTGLLVNTLTTTTGTALNVANTTIGPNNLEFRSISSGVAGGSGPANGINLNATGASGGLIVSGNGGVCTYATPTCSGGTIQSSTSDGIKLVSTRGVSLTRMRIHDNDTNGIYGDELTNFTLANSVVSDNDVANPSAFEAGVKFNELYGTNSITDTVVRGTKGDNIRLEMASGTLTNLTLTNAIVGPTANVGGGYSNGFSIVTSGTPTLNVTVTNSLFTGLDSSKQQSSGILTSIGGGTTTLSIIGSDFEHENIGIDIGSSSTGIHKFNIDNNDVVFHRTNAVNIVGSSVMDGTVNNNRIGNGTADSGSMNSFGIAASHRGNSTWFLALTNNVVKNSDFEGIFVRTGDLLAGDSGTVNLTLTDNVVFTPDDNSGFPANPKGMHLRSRQATTLCMNIEDNEAQGAGAAGYHLQESDTSSLRFQGFNTNGVTTLTAKNNKTAGGAPTTNEVGAPFAGACTPVLPSFP